jgi:DNA-binding PadR family transcriptional regulator
MVTINFTEEEAAESRELLKAVIKPLERSIAATDLGHREFREFLKKRRALVDELLKRLETKLSFELNDDEAQESIAMLKDAIPVLDRSIAATDLAHRDFREFLKKRRALVDELIKRIQK